MNMDLDIARAGFLDELEKIAASGPPVGGSQEHYSMYGEDEGPPMGGFGGKRPPPPDIDYTSGPGQAIWGMSEPMTQAALMYAAQPHHPAAVEELQGQLRRAGGPEARQGLEDALIAQKGRHGGIGGGVLGGALGLGAGLQLTHPLEQLLKPSLGPAATALGYAAPVVGALGGGALGHMAGKSMGEHSAKNLINRAYAGRIDLEGGKTAAPLSEEARSHIKKKNFAVSAKASNTGKPAYPIEDKRHAAIALGFAKMHHDKGDLAEVKKDVAKKYPGMVKKKASIDPAIFKVATFDTAAALRAGLEEGGPALGATAGAALAAGLGKPALTGAALGYGFGSLPELLLSKKHHHEAA